MTQNRIRPIAICVVRHQSRILVFEGYDSVKNEVFYRPLGGSIEFGEHSLNAVKREIKEELGAEICNISFLGSLEIIFEYNGRPGHEFVQVYEADFVNPKFYQTDSLEAYEDDGAELKVIWKKFLFLKMEKHLYIRMDCWSYWRKITEDIIFPTDRNNPTDLRISFYVFRDHLRD